MKSWMSSDSLRRRAVPELGKSEDVPRVTSASAFARALLAKRWQRKHRDSTTFELRTVLLSKRCLNTKEHQDRANLKHLTAPTRRRGKMVIKSKTSSKFWSKNALKFAKITPKFLSTRKNSVPETVSRNSRHSLQTQVVMSSLAFRFLLGTSPREFTSGRVAESKRFGSYSYYKQMPFSNGGKQEMLLASGMSKLLPPSVYPN